MKIYTPDYYPQFKCSASLCSNNCCIGWEIDIDEDTLNTYKNYTGKLSFDGKIAWDADVPHFILSENERCPFLNKDNLCDIIHEFGEQGLCQICSDHPRFKNFFSDRIETGIGLTCEEAARLILSQTSKFELILFDDDGKDINSELEEELFFSLRKRIQDILQNRQMSFEKRIRTVLSELKINIKPYSFEKLKNLFLSLEQLDPEWTKLLKATKKADSFDCSWDIQLENLASYFIFRHLAQGLNDGMYTERILFSFLSVYIIYSVFLTQNPSLENLINISHVLL